MVDGPIVSFLGENVNLIAIHLAKMIGQGEYQNNLAMILVGIGDCTLENETNMPLSKAFKMIKHMVRHYLRPLNCYLFTLINSLPFY